MPSSQYNAERASAQNQPVELYELELLNGVVLNFANAKADYSKPSSVKLVTSFGGAQNFQGYPDGPRGLISHIVVDQPQLRSTGAHPLRLRACSNRIMWSEYWGGWYPDYGNRKICLTISNNPGNMLQRDSDVIVSSPGAVYPRRPEDPPAGPYDGNGWGEPTFAYEGGAQPKYRIVFNGYYNVNGHDKPRCLIQAMGLPGGAFEFKGIASPYSGFGYSFSAPHLAQYYDKEGKEENGVFTPEWGDDTGSYSYFLFWNAVEETGDSAHRIVWQGNEGLQADPTIFTSGRVRQLYGGYDGAPDHGYKKWGIADAFTFRNKGSNIFHFFCVGCPTNASPTDSTTWSKVLYNQYDVSNGQWKYAVPVPVITAPSQGWMYMKPNVIYDPQSRMYYMVLHNYAYHANKPYLFANADIANESGWVAQENLPPDGAFGGASYTWSNLFNCYSEGQYSAPETYFSYPVKRDAIKRSSDDTVNSVAVYFSNVNHQFTQLLTSFDLRMSKLRIKRTFANLDPTVSGNVVTIFEGIIDEVALDKNYCKLTAKESLLMWDMTFPRRSYSTCCGFRFKGPGCYYQGPENFCDKTFETCGHYHNTDNFGGFTDAAVIQWRHKFKSSRSKGAGWSVYSGT